MARQVQVRPAAAPDAATVARVLQESFAEFEPLYTREGFAATTPRTEQVLVRMKEGPIWIAVRDTEGLGTVSAVSQGDSLYMRGMGVVPGGRGVGLGARLLEQVECFAAEQRHVRIFLSTTPFLHAAIRLYQEHGFRRTDAAPHELFGTPIFTMEKTILP